VATDFFERQRQARQQSFWLRALFALVLVLTSVLVAGGIVLFLGTSSLGAIFGEGDSGVLGNAFVHGHGGWNIAAGVLLFLLGCSALKAWSLRDGSDGLAHSLRATPIPQGTNNPRYRQLLNVISEMALASQVPEPTAWVLEREPGINAFAAGLGLEGAVIGVTAGALDHLDRDELQAVVAHEFSHILNGDMALNTRLISWLSGLFAIEGIARSLKGDNDNDEDKSSWRGFFFGVNVGIWILHACGYIGLVIGRLLQAAISRRREVLADASAVQFTRNPGALKSALLKVEAAQGAGHVQAGAAASMAHMFFVSSDSALGSWIERLQGSFFKTHPLMIDRVQAVDKKLTDAQFRAAVRNTRKDYLAAKERAVAPVVAGGEVLQAARSRNIPTESQDLLCSRLRGEHQKAVLDLQQQYSNSTDELQAIFVGALLDNNPARASSQLITIAPALGAAVATRVNNARQQLDSLPPLARLPLLLALLPAVAALPDQNRLRLVKVTRAFAERIPSLETVRFAASRLLLRTLVHDEVRRKLHAPDELVAPAGVYAQPASVVCSLMAQCSGPLGIKAYNAGMNGLLPILNRPPYLDQPIASSVVDVALKALAGLSHLQRASVCQALQRIIKANGTMGAAEFDLLRVFSTCMGVNTPATGLVAIEPQALQAASV
jgi:Zn-dependent protease with chaperone function